MVTQHTVTLFGMGAYDGVRASVVALDRAPEPSTMRLMAQHSAGPSALLFLAPTPDCPADTSTPTFNLRCFGRAGELDVPPLASFAAAHVLVAKGATRGVDSVTVLEGPRRMVFPVTASGQIRCTVELGPVAPLEVSSVVRLVVSDLFGIVRRGLTLDYVEAHRTLVVYDTQSTADQLRGLTPRAAPSAAKTAAQLRLGTVIVCVRDTTTGGLFARAFSPAQDYAETPMPAAATPYLRNDWDASDSSAVFEIAWALSGRPGRLVKQPDGRHHATLFARAASIQSSRS
ncbi:hypothetical protein IWQ56_001229 [Coemansia nantahalensis]|nr:hypothetical protein IWQ56_001229 [Coemansia nantahalensis]